MHPRLVLALIGELVLAGAVHTLVFRFDVFAPLARPLDCGVALGGRTLFGANKTWRGLVVMTAANAVIGGVLLSVTRPISPVPPVGWFGFGAIVGAAYILAELPNSFVKRRLGVAPGARHERHSRLQYVVDQADSVVGVVLVVALLLPVTAADVSVLVTAGIVAHVLFDGISHAVGGKAPSDAPE